VGSTHECALHWDGSARTLSCWGHNELGQLGRDHTTTDFPAPVELPGLPIAVRAGGLVPVIVDSYTRVSYGTPSGGHTCALVCESDCQTDGPRVTAWCWGDDTYGQLGDGTTDSGWLPRRVELDASLRAIATGGHHTCAIDEHDELWCWGDNSRGQLGVDPELTPFATVPTRVQLR
jgi:alpha-tubulin suppressor-like RCC1 family protein